MSSIQSIAENYQKFNPRAFLQNYYTPPCADFSQDCMGPWELCCLAQACATGEITGHTLVDIGSGPTVYQLLSVFEHFQEVVMTDYLPVNREETRRWLHAEAGAFDWSPYIRHVCTLEGKGEPWQEKQRRLRERVTRVLPVDIHQPSPLGEAVGRGSADALVSAFCLEASSPDREGFVRALGNVTGLLRAGGHLLLIGALEESYYMAGEARLTVVPLTEQEVREALCSTGYTVRDFQTYTMPPSLKIGVDDASGIFFAWAQKQPPK